MFPDVAVTGVQEATSVGPVLLLVQAVAMKLLPELALCVAQDCTGPVDATVASATQSVFFQPLPLEAAAVVQDATWTLVVVAVVQLTAR